MTPSNDPDYDRAYATLERAIAEAPFAQRELLEATDRAHAYADEHQDQLTDPQLLALKMLIGHAETILTRYFGM